MVKLLLRLVICVELSKLNNQTLIGQEWALHQMLKKIQFLYGIKGITRVGDNIIQEIILNRPYSSLQDFVDKMKTSDEKETY